MERMKILLPLILLVTLLCGCGKEAADITIMDNCFQSTTNSETRNMVCSDFEERLAQWQNENPDLILREKKQYHGAELGALARLGADHLPDIFMAGSLTGALLEAEGLVLDLSDFTEDYPEFTYSGAVYAFPVLNEAFSVIIYDRDGRQEATSDSVINSLSNVMADEAGREWLGHMTAGDKEVAFTDDFFVESISAARGMTESNAMQDFIEGKCHSVLLSGDKVYQLLQSVKENDPERYACLRFRSYAGNTIPRGYPYGLFLNAKLADDPDKLTLCLDLCRALAASGIAAEDETMQRLYQLLEETEPAPMWNQYLHSTIWAQLNGLISDETLTPKACAARMQDLYEQNYLNIGDYSKMLDYYSKYAKE